MSNYFLISILNLTSRNNFMAIEPVILGIMGLGGVIHLLDASYQKVQMLCSGIKSN